MCIILVSSSHGYTKNKFSCCWDSRLYCLAGNMELFFAGWCLWYKPVRGIPSQGRLGEGTSRKSFSGIQGQSPVRGFVGQSSPKPKLSVSLLIVNSCVFIIVAFLKDGDIVHLQTFDSVAEITVFLQRHLLIFQSLRPVVQPRFVKGVPWREMASARSVSLYRGSGGTAPRGVQGQSPWSRDQGGKAFAPLKLKAFQLFLFLRPTKAANLLYSLYFANAENLSCGGIHR